MNLGSVSRMVTVTTTQLCVSVWKQPEITCNQMGVAVFSKNFIYGHWNLKSIQFLCIPKMWFFFFFNQLKIWFKIYISSYPVECTKTDDSRIWPNTLPIPATKELVGNSLVAQRLNCLPPMRETQVWSLGREDPLEKEMVTHSSILAWRIPWTEYPGRLQSTGSQRVGHDWATSLSLFYPCPLPRRPQKHL